MTSPSASSPAPAAGRERRQNARLRGLIDEMLATIRTTVGHDLITDEDRAAADRMLGGIMARVRSEVVQRDAARAD